MSITTKRRPRDAYYTPNGERAIAALLNRVAVEGNICEPCAGRGSLVKPLRERGYAVLTNDIVNGYDARTHALPRVSWVITNPPFNQALPILTNALRYAQTGVAFLLRLSFLEPTFDRAVFFKRNPPRGLIVLPRMSFTKNGKTDNVTCAWMIWAKDTELTDFPVLSVAAELKVSRRNKTP